MHTLQLVLVAGALIKSNMTLAVAHEDKGEYYVNGALGLETVLPWCWLEVGGLVAGGA
jgi:hypothetical protein